MRKGLQLRWKTSTNVLSHYLERKVYAKHYGQLCSRYGFKDFLPLASFSHLSTSEKGSCLTLKAKDSFLLQ